MVTKHYRKTNVQTRTAPRTERRQRELTWNEEMVVRMRQGLSEGDDHVLEMRGTAFEQARARLFAIEADALVAIMGPEALVDAVGLDAAEDMIAYAEDTMGPLEPPVTLDSVQVDHDLKSRILDSLGAFED